MMTEHYDTVVLGAGLYGLYAAYKCVRNGRRVCILERDADAFSRATYINQARVHMGYHYPRSLTTALKSAGYFERFVEDFGFCINGNFRQIYATSAHLGWTNANEFSRFCKAADIPCEEVSVSRYFKNGMCDGAFLTKEYTYDAMMLRDYFLNELNGTQDIHIEYNTRPIAINKANDAEWRIQTNSGDEILAPFLLNATYAGVNDIHFLLDEENGSGEMFPIKYELCEIILCKPNNILKEVGLTVMDGPFFSIMPFGHTPYHSLTSVTFTPHYEFRGNLPEFPCQATATNGCTPGNLCNCNTCSEKPVSAWPLMSALARKYLNDDYQFQYEKSLYSMKPIMLASEVDDSRPTVVRVINEKPRLISVLSGKINTVYDLDPYLE